MAILFPVVHDYGVYLQFKFSSSASSLYDPGDQQFRRFFYCVDVTSSAEHEIPTLKIFLKKFAFDVTNPLV